MPPELVGMGHYLLAAVVCAVAGGLLYWALGRGPK